MDLTLQTVVILALALAAVLYVVVNDNWRSGVFFILGVGFLQDPFRKLVLDEPVAISASVAAVMLIVWKLGESQFRAVPEEMSLRRHFPAVVHSFMVFGALVLFQAMLTIINFGSIPLAGIGLIAYLSPLPGIWIGWWYGRTEEDLLKLPLAYGAFGILVAVGVYLSWSGTDWVIFKQVGEGIVIYDPIVGIVEPVSGFMRAPEVTAWHLGAASCFLILLATARPHPMRIVLFSVAIVFMVSAIYLTGRRKALGMVTLFVGIFTILLQFSKSRDAHSASIALFGLAIGVLGMVLYLTDDESAFRPYTARASSTYGDAWERFDSLGLGSVGMAINAVGFFGLGAGVVSQGGQYYGVNEQLAGAAEGGLGKIIVELGIPGLMVLTWVMWVIAKVVRQLLALARTSGGVTSTVMVGLIAFLMVNIIVFVTASQIFGDPFVLILLGIVFGTVLATSRILNMQYQNSIGAFSLDGSARGLPDDRYRGLRS